MFFLYKVKLLYFAFSSFGLNETKCHFYMDQITKVFHLIWFIFVYLKGKIHIQDFMRINRIEVYWFKGDVTIIKRRRCYKTAYYPWTKNLGRFKSVNCIWSLVQLWQLFFNFFFKVFFYRNFKVFFLNIIRFFYKNFCFFYSLLLFSNISLFS